MRISRTHCKSVQKTKLTGSFSIQGRGIGQRLIVLIGIIVCVLDGKGVIFLTRFSGFAAFFLIFAWFFVVLVEGIGVALTPSVSYVRMNGARCIISNAFVACFCCFFIIFLCFSILVGRISIVRMVIFTKF